MKWWLLAAVLLLGAWALHRLGLWAESRGWIYYSKKHGSSGTASAAFLEVQKVFEPSKEYVLEQTVNEHVEEHEAGDPPEPGKRGAVQREDAADEGADT